MKKIVLSICVAVLCCAWGAKAQQSLRYDITPNFLVNYLVELGVDSLFDKEVCDTLDIQNCDSVYSYFVGPSRNSTNPPYQYYPKENYVRVKTNASLSMTNPSAGINQGKTLNFGRNNASNYILYGGDKDSSWIQKTGDYGPALNGVEGPARVVFKWAPRTASLDPGSTETINMIIYVRSGSDTLYTDTAYYADGTKDRVLSFTSNHSGNKNIEFYVGNTYKGNLIWYYIKVYNPALGGYVIRSTPNIEGAGSVTRVPDKVGYDIGESVQLTAVTNTGYNFLRWSDGNTNETRSIAVGTEDVELNPIYEAQEVLFTVAVDPAGYGVVVRSPEKSDNMYLVGESVTLTATTPSSIYEEFVSWSDGNTSAMRTIVIPGENSDLTATFARKRTFTVDIAVEPEGAGIVQKTPQRDVYFLGELIDIKAIPNQRYGFVKWEFDDETSLEHGLPPISDNISTKAIFELKEAQLTTTVLPNRNYGTLTITPEPPANGIMEAYTDVVITANAADGNYFYAFVIDGVADSVKINPLNINMDGDKNVKAIMRRGTPPVTSVVRDIEYAYVQLGNVLYFQEPVSVKVISSMGVVQRTSQEAMEISLQGLAQANYLIQVEGVGGLGKTFWVQVK
ncbi:MAG: hypothetical protein LBH34_01465 [Prevotellaceae bacterium]|nr:hypothetical protein [Prevotellaceae bacterium]